MTSRDPAAISFAASRADLEALQPVLAGTQALLVDVDRATAFTVVGNPERLAACIPGCHDLVAVGPDKYTAVLTSQVGFVRVSFRVAIDVVRMEPPSGPGALTRSVAPSRAARSATGAEMSGEADWIEAQAESSAASRYCVIGSRLRGNDSFGQATDVGLSGSR